MFPKTKQKYDLTTHATIKLIFFYSRGTDVCFDCEKNNQHMMRYKAERNNLTVDKERLEKLVDQ